MMKPKKRLGQNFLTSREALAHIIEAAHLSAGETTLEVGPGRGVLTRALLSQGVSVIAIEKDESLAEGLAEMFSQEIEEEKLFLVGGDFLDVPMEDLALPKGYVVVANIPYYITGAILQKILTTQRQPARCVFLLQKEVAERITDERRGSILSLSVKAYGSPRIGGAVSREAFSPQPKVDSAILVIEEISRKNFATRQEEEFFFSLIKEGFAHKRKLLARNLEGLFSKEKIMRTFSSAKISPKTRAEELSLAEWLALVKEFKYLKL